MTPFQTLSSHSISDVSPGIEPGTSGMVVGHANHNTTKAVVFSAYLKVKKKLIKEIERPGE